MSDNMVSFLTAFLSGEGDRSHVALCTPYICVATSLTADEGIFPTSLSMVTQCLVALSVVLRFTVAWTLCRTAFTRISSPARLTADEGNFPTSLSMVTHAQCLVALSVVVRFTVAWTPIAFTRISPPARVVTTVDQSSTSFSTSLQGVAVCVP